MNKKLAQIIKEVRDKAYAEGHTDGTLVVMRLTQMAFCIAMNDVLGIGEERFEKVRQRAVEILGTEYVTEPEKTEYHMEERYEQITGHKIEESVTRRGQNESVQRVP